MLRIAKTAAVKLIVAAAFGCAATPTLSAEPPPIADSPTILSEETPPDPSLYEGESPVSPLDIADPSEATSEEFDDAEVPPQSYRPFMSWLNLRHSHTHGRNVGLGGPLVGTSWRNRPYYVGGQLGNVWMTQSVEPSVSGDVDAFGGVFVGCDWDHYWGSELALLRATPELMNSAAPDAERGDRLMLWSANLMYYPWGDSWFRPYWRWGIGGTELDYPTDAGFRRDETLWTIPIGMGIKYPVRRWLAARAELTDHWACGNGGIADQHNLSLTLGLEWRFGAHPRSYWPWHPSRHIW
jgi:Outer membrane protein beta-barrel domain